MPRDFTLGPIVVTLAILLLALFLVARSDPPLERGEVWRRGFLSGEQIVLMSAQRYEISAWGCFGPDEILETGAWSKLGETLSLVPSTPGRPARLLRMAVDGDTRTLRETLPGGAQPSESEIYERVD